MTPLCELAEQYGTDKLRHGYTPLYHELFAPMRGMPVNVVELGVYRGASVRMWADYFPDANIFAVDVRPAQLESVRGIERVKAVLADSGSPLLSDKLPDSIDILIDDASHKPCDQIAAFTSLWPRIAVGGYYVVEDLHAGWAFENGRHGFIDHLCGLLTDQARKAGGLGLYADVRFFMNLVAVRKT